MTIQKFTSITGGTVELSKLSSVCTSEVFFDKELYFHLAHLFTDVAENGPSQGLRNFELSESNRRYAPEMVKILKDFSKHLEMIENACQEEKEKKHSIRTPEPSFDPPPDPPLPLKVGEWDFTTPDKESAVTGSTTPRMLPSWGEKVQMDLGIKSIAHYVLNDFKQVDVPIALVDLGKVKNQHKLWVEHLPLITPFYAVKCNPDPMIIRTLDQQGANFDCATLLEIHMFFFLESQPIGLFSAIHVNHVLI